MEYVWFIPRTSELWQNPLVLKINRTSHYISRLASLPGYHFNSMDHSYVAVYENPKITIGSCCLYAFIRSESYLWLCYIFFFFSYTYLLLMDISQHRTVTAVYKYFGKSFFLYFSFSVCTHVPLFSCISRSAPGDQAGAVWGVVFGTDRKLIITINFLPRYRQLMYSLTLLYHLLQHDSHEVGNNDRLVPVHLNFCLNWLHLRHRTANTYRYYSYYHFFAPNRDPTIPYRIHGGIVLDHKY